MLAQSDIQASITAGQTDTLGSLSVAAHDNRCTAWVGDSGRQTSDTVTVFTDIIPSRHEQLESLPKLSATSKAARQHHHQ